MRGAWCIPMVGAVAACVLAGCNTAPKARSTRLADADLTQAVLSVREQLAASRFLRERDGSSPAARLVVRRVENISMDRIPPAEQWSLVSRVLSHRGMQELLRSRNIEVQLPPEKVRLFEEEGLEFPDMLAEDEPTHVIEAQIASGTRAGSLARSRDADIRKEYYLVSFTIEELDSREVLWQGSAEIAREAEGTIVD